jgi:hypothetical protein
LDNNYNTLFDSDHAEHDYIMSQPVKSPEVCAECAYYIECARRECDHCRQFEKNKRRCRCNSVADGHTVHDFDRRFALEDEGIVNPIHPFRWAMLDGDVQLRF